ncbi:UNVERIFIED_CONTAM: hypothetical protein HHA_449920 [Hammondia hammondi]|eukprot:XP_008882598.1 hypothetical protein HHA_449920 [Hammondia hammondi]
MMCHSEGLKSNEMANREVDLQGHTKAEKRDAEEATAARGESEASPDEREARRRRKARNSEGNELRHGSIGATRGAGAEDSHHRYEAQAASTSGI